MGMSLPERNYMSYGEQRRTEDQRLDDVTICYGTFYDLGC